MKKPFKLAVIAALSAAIPSHAVDTADLVLRGGVFHTVSAAGTVTGSLAVRAGRISYLGSDAGLADWIGPRTRVIELRGRAVAPGLIDAHSHLIGLGTALSQVDLTGSGSYAEVIERVRVAAAGLPPGTWVTGRGWDQNDWAVKEFPTHAALSAAVPGHPVWLRRVDGHAALANQSALAQSGVGAGTADPAGGKVLRGDDGEPTGVFVDAAMSLVDAKVPAPSAAELRRRLRAAATACVALGLTTVTDMGVGDAEIAAYDTALGAGELPLRAALFVDGSDRPLVDGWLARGPRVDPSARVLVRGIKLYADGALGSRGAALIEPYDDDPRNLGLLITAEDEIARIAAAALDRGFQVGVHTIGDRGGLVALDAIERVFGKPRPEARFRLEHAQVLRLQEFERLARLGVIASMQPTHATSDMPWAEARVGARRSAGAYAWQKVLRAGGRLALGSDFPVESPDPRLGLYAAITRQDLQGNPAGGWLPGERLSRAEALRGFTLDAAYSLFLDDQLGSLEVGKRADLVVFAGDPMTVDERALATLPVDFTLVEGAVVHQRERAP